MLGTVAFFAVVSGSILNTSNIAWLQKGDPRVTYLGWAFYRNSPWGLPLGLNQRYGMEMSSSILYSDSHPLMAIFFKSFSWLLPDVFQYFGLWLLVCFMLHAYFAWKLLGLATSNWLMRLLGTGFFVFSYPFLWRIEGHLTLVGQFVIVAGLYFNFAPKLNRRISAWTILLATTAAIHPYLLVMVFMLWVSDLWSRSIQKQIKATMVRREISVVLLVVISAMWAIGYFSIGSVPTEEGFGYFRSNLLTFFDSNGWSFVIRDQAQGGGDFEGAAFLGVGIICLSFLACIRAFQNRRGISKILKDHFPLFVTTALLSIFALSNNIGIRSSSFKYPLPQFLLNALGAFRASGRMIWPLFYLILFAVVAGTVKFNRRSVATLLLSVALLFQLFDSRDGWRSFREKTSVETSSEWSTALQSSLWSQLAAHYSALRWVSIGNDAEGSPDISYFAATHDMATNEVFQARINAEKRDAGIAQDSLSLASGKYLPNTLYVLSPQAFLQAMKTLNSTHDAIAMIDNLYVLAPNWKLCIKCTPLTDNLP